MLALYATGNNTGPGLGAFFPSVAVRHRDSHYSIPIRFPRDTPPPPLRGGWGVPPTVGAWAPAGPHSLGLNKNLIREVWTINDYFKIY